MESFASQPLLSATGASRGSLGPARLAESRSVFACAVLAGIAGHLLRSLHTAVPTGLARCYAGYCRVHVNCRVGLRLALAGHQEGLCNTRR